MKLRDPEAFLRAFGEYCFGPGEKPDDELQRLSRKLAWYETHFVNMAVDFVESGKAGEFLPEPGDWVGVREQKRVDVTLCPPSFQRAHPLMKNGYEPHSPLYYVEGEEWRDHVITIETKIIPNANWVDIWNSAFADLAGKDGKPGCDYVLACIHEFLPDRPAKARWYRETCGAFRAQKPGDVLRLRMSGDGQEEEQVHGGAKVSMSPDGRMLTSRSARPYLLRSGENRNGSGWSRTYSWCCLHAHRSIVEPWN